MMNYKHFVGIDISKHKLDIAVIEKSEVLIHQIIENSLQGVQRFLPLLKDLKGFSKQKTLFCIENTGIYGERLSYILTKKKFALVIENSLNIKRSMGLVRDKTDEKDAHRIALFAKKNYQELRLWEPPRQEMLRLKHLQEVRERLLKLSLALRQPNMEVGLFVDPSINKFKAKFTEPTIKAAEEDLKTIEFTIQNLINADARLSHLHALIKSVPGIGSQTATNILIRTNEFKSINDPKKFGCYCGVVPFKNESGLNIPKARLSPYADKKMKSLLHMCAIQSIRSDPEMRAYYLRRTQVDKKHKMSVLNAIRNKLILRVFACVGQNRNFEKKIPVDLMVTQDEDSAQQINTDR